MVWAFLEDRAQLEMEVRGPSHWQMGPEQRIQRSLGVLRGEGALPLCLTIGTGHLGARCQPNYS